MRGQVQPQQIPPLRSELEIHWRSDGSVDIRDPRLYHIYTIEAKYINTAKYFDGVKIASDVCAALKKDGTDMCEADVVEIAEALERLLLLDTQEARDASPSVDQSAPHSILEGVQRPLTVLPDYDENAKWSCHACGACCHGLVVELSDEELERINPQLYVDVLKENESFYLESFIDPEEPAKRVLRQRADDNYACVFLGKDGLCLIHARQGLEAKPDACQIYPYVVVHLANGSSRIALRTSCYTMYRSYNDGDSPQQAIGDIQRLMQTHTSLSIPAEIDFFGETKSFADVQAMFDDIRNTFSQDGVNPQTIDSIDSKYLFGIVRQSRRAFAQKILDYIREEREGEIPVEEGGLWSHFKDLPKPIKPLEPLKAMRAGRPISLPTGPVSEFLAHQIGLSLYGFAPLNFPDAGFGLAGLLHAVTAALYACGPHGTAEVAHRAFMAYSTPMLENTAHAWPVLEAINMEYADALRQDYLSCQIVEP